MTRLDFIPGTMCDERVWATLRPHLPAGCSARFVPLQQATSRRAMQQTIARESGDPAHLVAFSMGGYLALEHALSHPGQVASLTIIAASARGLGEQEKTQRLRTLELLARAPFAPMSPARLAQFVHPERLQDADVVGVMQRMYDTLGGEVLVAQIRETMDRPSLVARLPEITCPVLIVGAEQDRLVEVADLQEMQRHLPQAELCLLPQTGHMIPLERPRALGEAITRFLSRTGAA